MTMWDFDEAAFRDLEVLMKITSPSMNEVDMAANLRQLWAGYGLKVETDMMGNIHACVKGTRDVDVAVCAHMDTTAVQITKILPNGMLQFRRIGIIPHVLLGQRLVIKTEHGLVEGVVGFDPTSQYGQPKGLVEEDLWIDICVGSQQEAESMVSVGDLGVLEGALTTLNKDYLCGAGVDNRIGLFVLNECVKSFAGKECPVNLHFVATAQEEVGLRGAAVAASAGKFNVCIVLDVDYATDTLTPHENQMGSLKLGGGAGLQVKADNNPVLRRLANEAAQQKNIKCQTSVGRFLYGGTDSAPVQISGSGVATLNVSVPCRYMHSAVELCHKSDVESVVDLVHALIERIGVHQSCTFIPGID